MGDQHLLGDGRGQPKVFRIGDGNTQIVEQKKTDSTFYGQPPPTTIFEAFEQFAEAMSRLVNVISPIIGELAQAIEDEKIAERERSRADVKNKRRDMRRRKGRV